MQSTRHWLAGLAVVTCVAAAFVTAMILIPASSDIALVLPTIGWAIAPYVILIGISIFAGKRTESAWVALAGSLFVSVVGIYWLVDAFYIHPDPQSGLAVLVIPWLQWIGCGLTVAACLAMVFLKWLVWPERQMP